MDDTAQLGQKPYHALSVIPDIDKTILDGLAAGKSLHTIGQEHQVSDVAILQRARKYPDYKERIRLGAELRMGMRERELELAPDNVSVTRADRLLGHARWLAERLSPEEYGLRTQVDVNIDIGTALQALSERLSSQPIQGDCTVIAQDSDNLLIP